MLRPADNLRAGQVELSGGAAFNSLPEAVFVGQANVGITDWLELGGQYEIYSAVGWTRFGLLNTDNHGIAVALTVGGGAAQIWDSLNTDEWSDFEGAVFGGVTLGRHFGVIEPYVGYRIFYFPGLETTIQTIKGGLRFTGWETVFLGVEGGATVHHALLTLGEGALVVGLKLGGG
ncbi:MAG: hypothetical protein A2289_24705 [Deltaproteobacteria bacterium RIFOXYA12_FULL_58_15]|nr:MAG: hypothetical protein A2289_24705 [Deltaproteobacteria bacterium RIFOXYA12_FULL_58_15]OGR12690.1 MAG: hypothetical protein A2341_07715 [Deltaproteobacteria bacterium RIFOXYB12_FULL_58_9]